ncbi:MAG: ExbD/TolR family protein [Acidiferrobacteraceae bacterium]
MNFRREQRDEPEINLIPMIDVLLMTLIFLVLTTSFAREGRIRVKLPHASAKVSTMPLSLQVIIGPQGSYVVDRTRVRGSGIANIESALRLAAGGHHHPLVVIYADRKAPYDAVIHAMDAARRLGFLNLSFATRAQAGAPESP